MMSHPPTATAPTSPRPRRRAPRFLLAACSAGLALALGGCGDGARGAGPGGDAQTDTAKAGTSDGGPGASDGGPGATSQALDVQVLDVVAALRPVTAEATSDIKDQWLLRRRSTLTRMADSPSELGLALLDHLAAHPEYNEALRRDLLEAGALAAGPAASDELFQLVREYDGNRLGSDLALRGRAAMVLGRSDPERSFIELGRLLEHGLPGVTLPSTERLFEGFLAAAEGTGEDPVPVLAALATALRMEQAVRHRAIDALGDHDGPLVRGALVQVLHESTGNAYMRQKAAQSVVRAFPAQEATQIIEDLLEVEADTRMQEFLLDVLRTLQP